MRTKQLPVLVGVSAALFVSGMAQGVFTGIKTVEKAPDPVNPRLYILNLYLTFDDPGDRVLSVNGLIPALGQPQMYFRTNSSAGFHQELFFGADKNFAITAGELGAVPAMGNDTYFNVGIKTGETTTGGIASGGASDLSASTPTAINFGWNAGGKILESDPVTGGAFVMATFPPANDQNIAGTTPSGNQIFLAQLVIDRNTSTNDGGVPKIEVQIANVIWQDAAGNNHLAGFDPVTGLGEPLMAGLPPAPGTLAVLGVGGLFSFRRRRRDVLGSAPSARSPS